MSTYQEQIERAAALKKTKVIEGIFEDIRAGKYFGADALSKAFDAGVASCAVTEVVPHMADAPPVSRERIVQGHSFFPPSAAFPKGYATGHRPYSQGWTDASGKSSEACYICTCLAEIDRLERELAARSPQREKL